MNDHVCKRVLPVAIFTFFSSFAAADQMADDESIKATILANIKNISVVWNSGDMDGYLANYRQDDGLAVYSSGGEMRGAKVVNNVYRTSWSTVEEMGQFDTSDSVVNVLSPNVAVVHGLFEHRFPDKTLQGNYSMVWQFEEGDGWKIVHEHTARKQIIEHGN